ncbi:MAG: hypothetical protein KAK00_00535 [Nanoarchaeota archaeon]|nr:hypothetical protein [Nanoarchaeota archaeon]
MVDPRDRAEDTNTENLTATASQTTFSLTAPSGSVSCVTTVIVDSVTKVKWRDYYPDIRGESIIFFTALTGGEAVDVTYKYGTSNWIYDDKPNTKLSSSSFPRINIMLIAGPGVRLGNVDAPIMSSITFQIDIWAKERQTGQIWTIDSKVYTGQNLVDYLAYKINQAFEDNEDDLYPSLHDYIPSQSPPPDLPFNIEYQCFHKAVEFTINGISVGTVE